MRITPLDARKQEFRKAVRGYDCDEVRAFLTTLADEYETVLVDNKQLRERLMEQEDKIGEYKTMERTLRDTLMTAERLMQDTRESAGKEGDLIVRDAHLKARQILEECRVRTEELRRELVNLRKEKETYLARFKSLAEAQINFIETHRNDFQDLDKRLIAMVDAVIEGVDTQAVRSAKAADQPQAAPRPAAKSAPVWTEPAHEMDELDETPTAAAPAPAPAAAEHDMWRDYQPQVAKKETAPAAPAPAVEQPAASAPAPAPAAAPSQAHAQPEPQPAPRPGPAAPAAEHRYEHAPAPEPKPAPAQNPWSAGGGWGRTPAEAHGVTEADPFAPADPSDEADQAVAALHEDEAKPAPATAVW